MANKKFKTNQITELGQAVYNWWNVINKNTSFFGTSNKTMMRDIAYLNSDDIANRYVLSYACYRSSLPPETMGQLIDWIMGRGSFQQNNDFFAAQPQMRKILIDYVEDTWPDVEDIAEAIVDTNAVDSSIVVDSARMIFELENGILLYVTLDWDAAKNIAESCPDLNRPPISITVSTKDNDDTHIVCVDLNEIVNSIVEYIKQLKLTTN